MTSAPHAPNQYVYIFLDLSNIFAAAKSADPRGPLHSHDLRLQLENLHSLARAGRSVGGAWAVTSGDAGHVVDERLRKLGYDVTNLERGAKTGTEQGVDETLQLAMLRTILSFKNPGVAVLMAGDGAGYENGTGFHRTLEHMYEAGWGAELLSWDAACNRSMKAWVQSLGEHGAHISLDRYFAQITFEDRGGRRHSPLSTKGRARATPRAGGSTAQRDEHDGSDIK